MLDILKNKLIDKEEKSKFIKPLINEIKYLTKNYKLSKNNFEKIIMFNINKLKENIDQEEFNKYKQAIFKLLLIENM